MCFPFVLPPFPDVYFRNLERACCVIVTHISVWLDSFSFKVGFIFLTDAMFPLWHVVNNFTGVVKKLCGSLRHSLSLLASLIVQQVAQVARVVECKRGTSDGISARLRSADARWTVFRQAAEDRWRGLVLPKLGAPSRGRRPLMP